MEPLTPAERVVKAIASRGDKFILEVIAGLSGCVRDRGLGPWVEMQDQEWVRKTNEGLMVALITPRKTRWTAEILAEGGDLRTERITSHGSLKRAKVVLDQRLPRHGWKLE